MKELEMVFADTDTYKAAGEDGIPYEFLKHLGCKTRELFPHLLNKCWIKEEIPIGWRKAIIKPLLKEGKDPKRPHLIQTDLPHLMYGEDVREDSGRPTIIHHRTERPLQ